MNKERIKKLESASRSIIAEAILQNPDLSTDFGFVTITGVKISSDISYLDVFVSAMKNEDKLTKYLAKNNYEIERELGKKIQIRKLPRVRYRYDSTGSIGEEVCKTILEESNKYLK